MRTTHSPVPRSPIPLLCLAAFLLLPGCIVQDIHDRMEETSLAMTQANANLVRVTQELETANRVLDSRLAQIDLTNQHLQATQDRLAILESIDASLKALDVHLASLRRTLDNIDSTVPFLDLADPPPENEAAAPTDPPTEAPANPPSPPATPPPAPSP